MTSHSHPRRFRTGLLLLVGMVIAAIGGGLYHGFSQPAPAAVPEPDPVAVAVAVPVPLSGVTLPAGTRIGVIVTFGSDSAEGSEWSHAAEGARVAQQRLVLGGSDLTLYSEDDHGTSKGGKEAVAALLEEGVSGIILATDGEHIEGALAAAAEAGIPVILPYTSVPQGTQQVWSLSAGDGQTAAALEAALKDFEHPLLVEAGPGLPAGIAIADETVFASATTFDDYVADIATRCGVDSPGKGAYLGGTAEVFPSEAPAANPCDSLVVSGRPAMQAKLVYALQARGVEVPIVLTPTALSPAFAAALSQEGGSVSPMLRTVGGPWNDAVALNADAPGRAMSAFLAAARQLAGTDQVQNLMQDGSLATVVTDADVRSHDAVLAFAEAISAAGSNDPAQVAAALGSLTLDSKTGIAGPALDFSAPQAFGGALSTLRATSQQLGLRPPTDGQSIQLTWFPEPSAH